jgi:cell wall-associated NlpC family hydrolase
MRFRHCTSGFAILLLSALAFGCGKSLTAREARARLQPQPPPQLYDDSRSAGAQRAPGVPLRDVALAATTLHQPRRQIVEVALAMTGSPSKGVDCSRFAQQVYASSGQRLPRTVAAQLMSGTPVQGAELQPGDLLFFSFEKRPADHVGIYTGQGSFVHVSSLARGVRVESLQKSIFANALVARRRYVP